MAPAQLEASIACVQGYQSYWHFNTTTKRQGYSGVAVYVRHELAPLAAQAGLCALSAQGGRVLPAPLIQQLDAQIAHTGLTCRDLDAEGVSGPTALPARLGALAVPSFAAPAVP